MDDLRVLGDGRTVTIRLLSYGTEYRVSDDGEHFYNEVWRSGAFTRSLTHGKDAGVPLSYEHDVPGLPRLLPVGASRRAWEDGASFMLEGRISDTSTGRDLVELLRDGVIRGASIEAQVFNSRKILGGIERSEAALRRVAFTTVPQYADAGVLAVRSELGASESTPEATPRLDSLRARLDVLRSAEV